MQQPETPPSAQRVGRYHLIERLAVGGMAEVFLACQRGDQSLDRLVVLKRILPHLAQNPEFVEAFGREARITARIRHPNVVQIHELGEAGGLPFIAMEYVPGSTLKQLVVTARQMEVDVPVEVGVHLLMQACAGLHAAHELVDPQGKPYGLVHRDVSPHNLMVDDAALVKLLDFGIAKASEGMDHTRTGMLKGKISYMSPEQCRQERLDRRSDVFALGVCAFELFSGQRPFTASSELATMQAIVTGKSLRLETLRADLPPELVAVVGRAMALSPDERTPTADELRRELRRAWGREIDPDRCALFVRTLLGERHEHRRKAVEEALERTLVTFSGHPPLEAPHGRPDVTGDSIAPTTSSSEITRSGTTSGRGAPPRETPAQAPERPPRSMAARLLPWVAAIGLGGLGLAFALALALAAWIGRMDPMILTGDPVVVRLAPIGAPERLARDYEPIRGYLQRELRAPVTFTVADSYEGAAADVVEGEVPFAFLPPGTVAHAIAKDPGISVLAVKVVDGSASTDGYLVVRRDDDAPRSIEDLRGRTVCLTSSHLSTTGWVLPRKFLEDAGYALDRDLRIHESANHQAVLEDVLGGVCDVGATYSGNFNSADQLGIATAQLRILAMTGISAHDAFVAGSRADPELVEAMRAALLAFDPQRDVGTSRVGESELVTGFVVPPSDYLPAPSAAPAP